MNFSLILLAAVWLTMNPGSAVATQVKSHSIPLPWPVSRVCFLSKAHSSRKKYPILALGIPHRLPKGGVIRRTKSIAAIQHKPFVPPTSRSAIDQPSPTTTHYTFHEPIGSGTQGVVYKVEDSMGNTFAAKCDFGTIDAQAPLSLYREYILQRKAGKHRFVLPAHDYIVNPLPNAAKESHCIIMDYSPYKSLHMLIYERYGPLTVSEARTVFYRIFVAVAELHANNIISRDIKLANILFMDPSPRWLAMQQQGRRRRVLAAPSTPLAYLTQPRLADFGYGLSLDDPTTTSPEDMSMHCGTPGYAAPEMYVKWSYPIADLRTADAFSLGVTLRTALTAADPIYLEAHPKDMANAMARLDAGAREVVEGLTREDPLQRWTVAQALKARWFNPARNAAMLA